MEVGICGAISGVSQMARLNGYCQLWMQYASLRSPMGLQKNRTQKSSWKYTVSGCPDRKNYLVPSYPHPSCLCNTLRLQTPSARRTSRVDEVRRPADNSELVGKPVKQKLHIMYGIRRVYILAAHSYSSLFILSSLQRQKSLLLTLLHPGLTIQIQIFGKTDCPRTRKEKKQSPASSRPQGQYRRDSKKNDGREKNYVPAKVKAHF